jgi:hypothetical protein
MAFVLPNSPWSGAQADTKMHFETASIFEKKILTNFSTTHFRIYF